MKTLSLIQAIEILRAAYGSHVRAAEAIGISRDHYRRLRNGRAPIPRRVAEYIVLSAQQMGRGSGAGGDAAGESHAQN